MGNIHEIEPKRRHQTKGKASAAPQLRATVVPLRLAPPAISLDTVDCLRQLLDEALRGELVGLAFAAMYRGQKYCVEAAGEAHLNPTFAAGMAASLRDLLARRARGED